MQFTIGSHAGRVRVVMLDMRYAADAVSGDLLGQVCAGNLD